MASKVVEKIFEVKMVPLVVLEDENDAVPMAKALVEGGIPIAEVTFRTKAAKAVIEKMSREVPEILVGAGTVHNVEQAADAVEAGAEFIVTPGFNREVVEWCLEREIDVVPGTVTPSDLEQALSMGLSFCKFFPAEAYGGIKTLKALAGPYADIKFMPTGGINETNWKDYLALDNVAAIGGSFMVPMSMVKEKNWDGIKEICKSSQNCI